MELKIKLVRTPQEQKNVLDIRRSVFIDEQQIPVEIEIDAFEERLGKLEDKSGGRF